MHQQARHPPRVASPASSPQMNPFRSNNPREGEGPAPPHGRAGSGPLAHDPSSSPSPDTSPSAESYKKLDQIIQNFHTKAASVILDSRMNLRYASGSKGSGTRKINKWFQLDTEDFEDFKEDLRAWRTCSVVDNHPPPLVIETYLHTSRLNPSQTLVVVDENGKRWDVMEALNSFDSTDDHPGPPARRTTEVVLERWRIQLKTDSSLDLDEFGPLLPTIYKKIIVFFRSLFVTTRVIPAWKVSQQALTKGVHPALEPRCRIRMGETDLHGLDPVRYPLYDGPGDVATDYVFGDLDVPVGRLVTSVTYRNECTFRIENSESLLSSRFMGIDEDFFKPSLPQRSVPRRQETEVGSLPSHRRGPGAFQPPQTYGSLSTFHGEGAIATSPITALRAVRPPGSDTSSPPGSVPASVDQNPPHSLPVTAMRPQLRGVVAGSGARRPSVSFQPFKAGSLSGSPMSRTLDSDSPASPSSATTRAPGAAGLYQPRNRTSLTAGMPASLRGGPPPPAEVVPPGSPRPGSTSRYSSSFTHRRGRHSVSGASRADDEQGSSGRQSLSSSVAQPGSGLLAEAGANASSGSLQTDDDQISEFLKALESKKTLKSFEPTERGESATNRTVAQLSKFHAMRDSNNALTEYMASSLQMQRSSSSSSRQLSNVPSMAAPASASISSSPGKPLSPHTPHTPIVPSRLSENAVIRYGTSRTRTERRASTPREGPSEAGREDATRTAQTATATATATTTTATTTATTTTTTTTTTTQEGGTTAIDIPMSPRMGTHPRRSSSAAQQNRALADEEDGGDLAFAANRSVSLGAEDREPPTLSMLLGRHAEAEAASNAGDGASSSSLQPAAEIHHHTTHHGSSDGSKPPGGLISAPSSSPFGRRRYMGMTAAAAGRGQTPPQSSRGSFTGSIGRYGYGRGGENETMDDEPLLFDMSEMDAQGRRSVEEGRGGGHVGSGSGGRTEFEPRGVSRRGW
ncbi:hypothetical protein SODALDRAFT_36054 [Sodiomyces alkalinus F11]|uniref:Autophagy-related protein 13 n=1 Tax=Sodiomyces alkalinus (strain CBS 110278 / VKM F-3762 / F11) TaxID=1314773 RepID=A0A3N2Q9J8_SODAK|nr:hypothetical protein SODALDRAFT_36054 [Sodiomyces alkalinus F11]ROT43315.1 hypothetical protein SODALDRAFT_36054 [Sodiomyces alkalinus F11]